MESLELVEPGPTYAWNPLKIRLLGPLCSQGPNFVRKPDLLWLWLRRNILNVMGRVYCVGWRLISALASHHEYNPRYILNLLFKVNCVCLFGGILEYEEDVLRFWLRSTNTTLDTY